MVVDLIGIFELKGPYCTLMMTDWVLQALSVISRGSWGDVARCFTIIQWINRSDLIVDRDYDEATTMDLKQMFTGPRPNPGPLTWVKPVRPAGTQNGDLPAVVPLKLAGLPADPAKANTDPSSPKTGKTKEVKPQCDDSADHHRVVVFRRHDSTGHHNRYVGPFRHDDSANRSQRANGIQHTKKSCSIWHPQPVQVCCLKISWRSLTEAAWELKSVQGI
ncbi:aldose 1-epimerase-like [Dorcoceras hygrometricum]|uniref:Aldose 1-epimerase-like n=1 Tax=Dorcoceras hygrometricum TaxID=472368 RepID=A0A2Z7ADU4_9LAMI|nr:aldose 1-epimerase-like [Dorcoceras hygrometricum]